MQIDFFGSEGDWEATEPVEIDLSEYMEVHEVQPSGVAFWWFDISPPGSLYPRIWSAVPGSTFKEAVQQVAVRAKYSGCTFARLLS